MESMDRVIGRISDIIEKFDTQPRSALKTSLSKRLETGENSSVTAAFVGGTTRAGKNFSEELQSLIDTKSAQYGISSDLVKAVIHTESNGNPKAVSRAGAIGLMQLMPETANGLGVNPWNPEENVDGGIRYLMSMAEKFGSLDEVLAAYNAGPNAVKKHKGIPPYEETQNYVKKIRKLLVDEKG